VHLRFTVNVEIHSQ